MRHRKQGSKMRRRVIAVVAAASATMLGLVVMKSSAFAGPGATQAGFEGHDGNLAPEAPINFDWNSFAPTTWTGTAPNRTASKTVSGWAFTGPEDAQATNSASAV